jgi:Domain of unknown function (DUF6249)
MNHIGITVAVVTFLVWLAIVAVAGIMSDYRKRRLELEPLRVAVERGQHLDPAIVERLMRGTRPEPSEPDPVQLRIGGIVTVASGIGVGLLSFFIKVIAPIALYPILGSGVLVVCVGVGLLLSARVVEKARGERAARKASV